MSMLPNLLAVLRLVLLLSTVASSACSLALWRDRPVPAAARVESSVPADLADLAGRWVAEVQWDGEYPATGVPYTGTSSSVITLEPSETGWTGEFVDVMRLRDKSPSGSDLSLTATCTLQLSIVGNTVSGVGAAHSVRPAATPVDDQLDVTGVVQSDGLHLTLRSKRTPYVRSAVWKRLATDR